MRNGLHVFGNYREMKLDLINTEHRGGLSRGRLPDRGGSAGHPDGGKLATVCGFAGPSEPGITTEPVRVMRYSHNREELDHLGQLVAEGRITLQMAATFHPSERRARSDRWTRMEPEAGS